MPQETRQVPVGQPDPLCLLLFSHFSVWSLCQRESLEIFKLGNDIMDRVFYKISRVVVGRVDWGI